MSTPDQNLRPYTPEQPPAIPPVEQPPVAPAQPEQQPVLAPVTTTHPETMAPVNSPVDVIGRAHEEQLQRAAEATAPVNPDIAAIPTPQPANLGEGIEAAMGHEDMGAVAVAAETVFDQSLDHPDDPNNP